MCLLIENAYGILLTMSSKLLIVILRARHAQQGNADAPTLSGEGLGHACR
jgi:hypothetical protein